MSRIRGSWTTSSRGRSSARGVMVGDTCEEQGLAVINALDDGVWEGHQRLEAVDLVLSSTGESGAELLRHPVQSGRPVCACRLRHLDRLDRPVGSGSQR